MVYVIGIGFRPLDKRSRDIIYNSEAILASQRLFEVFRCYEEFEMVKDKVKVINNVEETINFIKSKIQKPKSEDIVLLASGDPMFFGIGRRVINEFGKEVVEILPDLSSIQMAFSRIKETWGDAFFVSLHGGPDPTKRRKLEYEIGDIPSLLMRHNKIAILTDKVNNPAQIAKTLLKSEIRNLKSQTLKMYVCEKLGYPLPDEKITEAEPEAIAEMSFSDPNVVIIIQDLGFRIQDTGLKFGLTENEIKHSGGLITKDEVRAVTLHKLRPPLSGVFWDVGAGSGAVSIEVARLCPELNVFAIEKDDGQIENISKNIKRFNVTNIEVIKGEAPGILKDLPSPHRVFIGGSGERLKEIIEAVNKKMPSGIIVINAVTIETLNGAMQWLEEGGFKVEVSEISISRAKIINQKRHMSALNPVFIVTGGRP